MSFPYIPTTTPSPNHVIISKAQKGSIKKGTIKVAMGLWQVAICNYTFINEANFFGVRTIM
jgi:hypothetical protein